MTDTQVSVDPDAVNRIRYLERKLHCIAATCAVLMVISVGLFFVPIGLVIVNGFVSTEVALLLLSPPIALLISMVIHALLAEGPKTELGMLRIRRAAQAMTEKAQFEAQSAEFQDMAAYYKALTEGVD